MITLSEALQVSSEARAIMSSTAGPAQQEKAKTILDGALEVIASHVSKPAAKAEKKKEA